MKNKKIKNVTFFINLKRIGKLIWEIDKKYIFIALATTIVLGLVPATSLKVMQYIINSIQISRSKFNDILYLIIIYFCIDLFQMVIQAILGYYNTKFNLKFDLFVKKNLLMTASKLHLKQYENSEVYDLIQRAQAESEGKLISFFSKFMTIIHNLIILLSYLIILSEFSIWIIPIIMTIPIIEYFISNHLNEKQFNVIRNRTNEERKTWYYSYIITNGNSYKELKIYNLFNHFIEQYEKYKVKFNNQDMKISKEKLVKLSILDLFEQILNGLLFVYIVYNGFIGFILIGSVITYTRAVISTKGQIQIILKMISNLRKENLYINQLFEFIDLSETSANNTTHEGVKIKEINEIVIEHLYYKYRSEEDYVLKDVSLKFNKGEFYTIVGRNGSGKSTLAKILLGFYDDYEGSILINGTDLRLIDKDSYISNVSSLFQDFTKFEGSIRENIAYGNMSLVKDDKSIFNIINKFGITDIMNNKKKLLDTQLGYWFNSGKQISSGEWQKIALSRCIIKECDFYILDEPNATLDTISEFEISKMYKGLFKNKIGLIIAHKFNNFIENTNNIIVLDKGKIIEQGNHESLIRHKGTYYQIYNSHNLKEADYKLKNIESV